MPCAEPAALKGRPSDEAAVESFDVAPDGRRLIAAAWVQLFSLMEARGIKGVTWTPPGSRQPAR